MNPPGLEQEEPLTAAERWGAIPLWWRALLVAAAALVVIQLGLSLFDGIIGSAPAGDGSSSSFGTAPSGVAALAQLLAQHGHPVDRSTRPVSDSVISPGSTLFVVDPSGWTEADTAAVRHLVQSGGHVVVAGEPPGNLLLSAMFGPGGLPRWHDASSGTAHAVGSTPAVNGVQFVTAGAVGSITTAVSAQPILVGPHGILAVSSNSYAAGSSRAIFLASSTPLTNADLAEQDNAAFALNLAGPAGGPVVFDEFDHGYGRTGGGLAGLPEWWRWGLALVLAAIIIWMISAARRFGPVEAASRQLIPPRMEYAEAMATVLAALPEERLANTVEPLRAEARILLCRRSGTQRNAPDLDVVAAARRAHIPEQVVSSVLDQPGREAGAVALGTALAWLESHTGGRP